MANADFLVTWPNLATGASPSSPFTLSHRNTPGEIMPVVASSASATSTDVFYTLLPALSTPDAGASYTVVSYLRLLAMPADYVTTSAMKTIARGPQNFIYASCSVKPASAAQDAVLTQHDQVST